MIYEMKQNSKFKIVYSNMYMTYLQA